MTAVVFPAPSLAQIKTASPHKNAPATISAFSDESVKKGRINAGRGDKIGKKVDLMENALALRIAAGIKSARLKGNGRKIPPK